MLQRSLIEKAAGCFYGGERFAERLWQALCEPPAGMGTQGLQTLQRQCYELLSADLDQRYPHEHRLNDIRHLLGRWCDETFLQCPALPWLDELDRQLLQRNGDLLCYRETEAQAYVRLAAEFDPTLLVAWHFSDWLQRLGLVAHDIRRVIEAQTPFFAPPGNAALPFAEGHVHIGGVTVDSIILANYLFDEAELKPQAPRDLWGKDQNAKLNLYLRRARELLSLLLSGAHVEIEVGGGEAWLRKLQRLIDPMAGGLHLPHWQTLAESQRGAVPGSRSWVLGEFARAMDSASHHRWLWLNLYLCLRYRDQATAPLERAAILCWWQTVNLLRRSLIMAGQGLTRFAERAYRALLRNNVDTGDDLVRRLFSGRGDVVEFKSGPVFFAPQKLRQVAKWVARHTQVKPLPPYLFGEHEIPADARSEAYLKQMERWQFCAHFFRSSKHIQNRRAKADSQALWEEAEKLRRSLLQESGWNQPEFLGGKLNRNFNFQPARWFRGLDVAGDENVLKIEWFAPILRWLRDGFMARPDGERPSTGFHLSIHAGEDYPHPASGMRHVDETVQFCEMRDGDRLGHALALGIKPKTWVKRQGEMLLPLDEHLDNLVWLWHYASVLSARLPEAQQALPLLARRIERFYPIWRRRLEEPDDFGFAQRTEPADCLRREDVEPMTHEQLYQAWHLRRNCYYTWRGLHGDQPRATREEVAVPDHLALDRSGDPMSLLYRLRHQFLARGVREDRLPLVIISLGDTTDLFECFSPGKPKKKADCALARDRCQCRFEDSERELRDVETPAELEFMHALQDYLLDEYDRRGLIIEANPTSNVYIARLESHCEHPIFRWHPPDESVLVKGKKANRFGLRRGPVRVLVNTDDPGIMPTTLRTEFLLLREAALEIGVGRTVAERWLESLRQYGVEQFHRNHLPVFEGL